MDYLDLPPLQRAAGTVKLPGSKSISNRMLLLAALAEATAWIKANGDDAWLVFSRSGKELDSTLNKLAWKDTLPLLAPDPTALDRDRYAVFADFLVKRGQIKQVPPLDSYLREIR